MESNSYIEKSSEAGFLEEGKAYSFTVSNELELPGDETYYIIIDPWGNKHLLVKKYYLHYGLEPGQLIKCKVDRINCHGRIFMEPESPFYKIGEIYEFEYLRNDVITKKDGDQYSVMVVRDAFGMEGYITIFNGDLYNSPPKIIAARVNRVKKASVYASQADF